MWRIAILIIWLVVSMIILGNNATAGQSTVINARVQTSIEVTAPAQIEDWLLNIGPNDNGPNNLLIDSNADGWYVQAVADNYGYLRGADGNYMSQNSGWGNKLHVDATTWAGNGTTFDVALSDNAADLITNGQGKYEQVAIPLIFHQTVTGRDVVESYSTTVTFSAGFP